MKVRAVILDLDGVVTHTAKIHAAAWKRLFDEYSERRFARGDSAYEPFDVEHDYLTFVDGKARQDGVRSFLESRRVLLPLGGIDDLPGVETCHGLGNQKDIYFKELLEKRGPEVFEDAVISLVRWRKDGLRTAVASSSRNCREILRLAGLESLFDVRVDGTHLQKWNLAGKPAPDLFLAAAKRLKVEPSEAVLFEDATAGVEAGKNGHFGLVVGVARHGSGDALIRAGADTIVGKLTDLVIGSSGVKKAENF